MSTEKKKLVLFTSEFPYGTGEQFIETEIKILGEHFSKIYIFPLTISGNKRDVPSNVEIVEPKLYSAYKRTKVLSGNLLLIMAIYGSMVLRSPNRFNYFKEFKRWFNFLLNRINDADWLQKELDKRIDSDTVIYSYWFNLWGNILSIIKKRKGKQFNFFTRIHGGDFDKDRKKDGYFPFREFELTQVGHIYAVSNFGLNYMKKTYSNINFNISLGRLGVLDHGDNPYNSGKGFYQIVSCSFLYALKRVHLIVDILSNTKNIKIVWTHFGSGELEATVLKYAKEKLGDNFKIDFRGLVPNQEVIEFYKKNPVDLFINTSELEGIPVSLMEAISFGIPIIGCDICGVPEIVNDQTGILIPKHFNPAVVGNKVNQLLVTNEVDMMKRRRKVKEFWHHNFNGIENYHAFSNTISQEF